MSVAEFALWGAALLAGVAAHWGRVRMQRPDSTDRMDVVAEVAKAMGLVVMGLCVALATAIRCAR